MRNVKRLFIVATSAFVACHSPSEILEPDPNGFGVLFIGNSLTYQNDLPGVFRDLASTGGYTFHVLSLARPGHALVDYVLDGSVQPIVASTPWHYIVMQQGPSTVGVCRDTLVLAVKEIDRLGKRVGAKSVVMMSWPAMTSLSALPLVHESFAMAAREVDGLFAPVGDAWQTALTNDPSVQLYADDGYHPAVIGTYLAALVLYEQITGQDARQLQANAPIYSGAVQIPEHTVRMLQQAAHTANMKVRGEQVAPWMQTPAGGAGSRC